MTAYECQQPRRLPTGSMPVRHGYTLDDVARAARCAVSSAWAQAADYVERLEAAWLGVVDRLIEEPVPPTVGELVWSGQQAVNAAVRAERREGGKDRGFQRYWWFAAAREPDHAVGVVERRAVEQIMPQLSELQRSTLLALAICGDYRRAADLMEMGYEHFHGHVRKARLRFLALWHEGEAPSPMWGNDRRRWRADTPPNLDRRPTLVRRRAALARRRRDVKAAAS